MANLIEGTKELTNILRDFDRKDQKNLLNSVLRSIARRQILPAVRDKIPDQLPEGKGFPEHILSTLKGLVTVRTFKGKAPGVYVKVPGRGAGAGVVELNGKNITAAGAMGLVTQGSYKGDRQTKAGKNRGRVEGIGDIFGEVYRSKGPGALKNAAFELSKVIERRMKRLAKRGNTN